MRRLAGLGWLLLGLWPAGALAQWQACTALAEPAARLACFDQWAQGELAPPPVVARPAPPAAAPAAAAPAPAAPATLRLGTLRLTRKEGCHNAALSTLSRHWELEGASDCGNFGLRALRPTSVAVATADTVNTQPVSGNVLNVATVAQPFRTTEMRVQLSVRTKIATDMLPPAYPDASDSLWFAYSQLSYWQLFTPEISRPFRSTDHEPEVVYLHPLQPADRSRWRLRYAGLGLVHHSNGQSLPLSRSWNRVYLMAGAEYGSVHLYGRLWRRLKESAGKDDNPAIGDTYGRAELSLGWQANRSNQLQLTARHSLQRSARGSWRLEWFRTLAGDDGSGVPAGLQLHTQLFTGYGDTLLDYNRRRNVFSVGLSLADW